MHSTIQRLQNVGSLALSVLFGLLLCVAVSSFALVPSTLPTPARLDVDPFNVVLGRGRHFGGSQEEFGFTTFDLKADLRPLFNWNTKQLLLQLTADYTSGSSTPNSFVLWDKLVLSPSKARLDLSGARNKYPFKDPSGSFRGATNVTFSIAYHLMPHVGFLTSGVVATDIKTVASLPLPRKNL